MIFFIFTLKGFCYQRKEIKLSQYADDTQILLDGSEKSIRNTVNLLNNFTKISGLKVNYNKSELAPLGRSRMEIYTHNFSLGMKITVGNTDKKYVSCGTIKLFIIVTFPNKVKLLLLHD
jgi:hypothetical protein